MQTDPHFFGDGHRHTNVGLRIKGLFVATTTADQFIPFDLSIVKHLSGQQDMCWSASIGVLCCRNRVQGVFFLWNLLYKIMMFQYFKISHIMRDSIFLAKPHQISSHTSTFSNPKCHAKNRIGSLMVLQETR